MNTSIYNLDGLATSSDLAFAMDGDARVHTTTRKIARVPLSDYSQPTDSPLADNTTISDVPTTRLHDLCTSLEFWQEHQTVQQHIDVRFRFRCLLSWLQASTPAHPRRIKAKAATFLLSHPREQYELLKVEDANSQDIMQVRQEEGLALTEAQEQRVVELEEEMRQAAEAIEKVGELVELAVAGGLVEGELVDLSRTEGVRSGEGGEQEVKREPVGMEMEWEVDSSIRWALGTPPAR